ncbi:GLPGLI family protein [Pedobacter xixiisoli]|uniref:GLPGLI family protein n=1 Tax=Pedobacter xixiisoli TaxID=1476464 RepID=A0A286AEI8_9SPHI|nr:GLPGLI family protein [Pedobacter xixiisoli]SOD20297.1 GLPGLI family protein [Pedobacter xixiisoli]
MKTLKYIVITYLLLATFSSSAQNARFVTQGTIEYEKRVNAYALIKDQIKIWGDASYYTPVFENYQKNNPQFKTAKSKLFFSNETTAFIPEEEAIVASSNWFSSMIEFQQANKILTDLKTGTSKTQKKVYDETYLLSDSTRKINWKITDEFRNIAGYNCRRANALVMDSVYVVAFYSEEIAVSGGPESFSGLPGMILGLALPHDHVTWFATSVTDASVGEDKLKIPTKGKAVNNKQLYDILKGALKSWGKSAHQTFKWAMM